MTVLVWGVPSESPVRLIADALTGIGADVVAVSPAAQNIQLDLGIGDDGQLDGFLQVDGRRLGWDQLTGVYARPVEPDLAPQFRGLSFDAPGPRHAAAVHEALIAFTEEAGRAGRRVANRLSAMACNMSKPYQAQLIARHGFAVPETLISDKPDEVLAFTAAYPGAIYKSISGIRSVVTAFDPETDDHRLARLRWCQVQFQERIDGPNVRVHVVGDRVFPSIVESTAVDYRYARAQVGQDARLQPYELPDEWAQRCVALAADLDLPFAGIDLKLARAGGWSASR